MTQDIRHAIIRNFFALSTATLTLAVFVLAQAPAQSDEVVGFCPPGAYCVDGNSGSEGLTKRMTVRPSDLGTPQGVTKNSAHLHSDHVVARNATAPAASPTPFDAAAYARETTAQLGGYSTNVTYTPKEWQKLPAPAVPSGRGAIASNSAQTTPSVQSSSPSIPVPPPAPAKGNYVYERLFTDVHITIEDAGYGLTDEDKANLKTMLDRLPIEQLKGLKEIAVRPINGEPGQVYINATSKSASVSMSPQRDAVDRLSLITEAVGKFVYQNFLTGAEKYEFNQISSKSALNVNDPALQFSLLYERYINNSVSLLSAASQGPVMVDGQSVGWKPQNDLLPVLFVATTFVNSRTSVVPIYSTQNGVVSMEYGAAGRNRYVDTYKHIDDRSISFGPISYRVEDGKITGYSQDAGPMPSAGPLNIVPIDPPVALPNLVTPSIFNTLPSQTTFVEYVGQP